MPTLPRTERRDFARKLRHESTLAERLLWAEIRDFRNLGFPFRRQVSIGKYFADFACHRRKLVIEIDGDTHETETGRKHDAVRDAYLRSQGFKIMRFDEPDVRENAYWAAQEIRKALMIDEDATPARPVAFAPVHPPRKGEGDA